MCTGLLATVLSREPPLAPVRPTRHRSQFNIMCTYMWWFARDAYSFHFLRPDENKPLTGPDDPWYARIVDAADRRYGIVKGDHHWVTVANSAPVVRPFIHARYHDQGRAVSEQLAKGVGSGAQSISHLSDA